MNDEQKITKITKIIIGIVCTLMLILVKDYYYWLYYIFPSVGAFGLVLATFPIILLTSIVFVILKIAKKRKKFFDWLSIIGLALFSFFMVIVTLLTAVFFTDQLPRMAAIQNDLEQPKLVKYHKAFNYLEKYKKENGVYPDKIDKNALDIKTEGFKKYVYKVSEDNKKYVIRIYTQYGPIEYYTHKSDYEENQKNKGDGNKRIEATSDYLEDNLYEDFKPHPIYYKKEKNLNN